MRIDCIKKTGFDWVVKTLPRRGRQGYRRDGGKAVRRRDMGREMALRQGALR